jgi:hypothetical protein
MKGISMRSAVVASAIMVLTSGPVRANTITPIFIAGSAPGTFSYALQFTSGELRPGDGFTIFDFGGFAGVATTPINWSSNATFTTSPWGTPISNTDDAALVNVHLTYNGPIVQEPLSSFIGPFAILTTSTVTSADEWVSQDHILALGLPSVNKGGTVVPGAPLVVPDGGWTLAFLGLSLLTIGMLRRMSLA